MHFPTSIPRSTGSPAAALFQDRPSIATRSVHSDPYDGPIPVLPALPRNRPRPLSYGRPQYRRYLDARESPIFPPTPVYSYIPPKAAGSGAGSAADAVNSAGSLANDGGSLRPATNDSATSPQAPDSANPSIPNIDGAGKLLSMPAIGKSKIKAHEFRKMFAKKRGKQEEDPEESPTEASEFYEIKRKKSERSQAKLNESAPTGEKSTNSSRARLAARLMRHRGRAGAVETGLDLDDSDHHPFDAARKRFHEQRERKMRRGGAESKDSFISKSDSAPEKRHHRFAESVRKGVRFAGPKEHVAAYKASKGGDKSEVEAGAGEGSRVGNNSMGRMSGHLARNAEEPQEQAGRASWTSGDQVRSRRASEQLAYASTSSSSPDEFQVPRASELPDFPAPPGSKSMNIITQPPANPAATQPRPAPDPVSPRTAASPYGQMMFPPKPPAPFFRPTLSPVSSRSPVPTSIEHAATDSPKRSIKDREKSRPVSASPRMHSLEQDPSASSLHLPLVETLPSSTPPQKPGGLTIRNGVPTISTQSSSSEDGSAPEAAGLSPIMEHSTTTTTESRRSSQNSAAAKKSAQKPEHSLVADDALSSLNLARDIKSARSSLGRSPSKSPAESARTERAKPQSSGNPAGSVDSGVPSRPPSEVPRPRSPPPHPSPSPVKISSRTPTSSALEFWREADESLAPSESASAQPPNYNGEPPPSFWKTADQSLAARREAGPTIEEWIASLPGLGLGLGTWGSHDGALDWKYFQSLKAKNKLKKSRSGLSSASSQKTVRTVKSVQDMITENIESLEKVIEEIEENSNSRSNARSGGDAEQGLTPDEAEALDDDATDPFAEPVEHEAVVDNNPPALVDPDLLHPEYRPCPSPGPILSSQRPQSRLGRDVAMRLDNMEKYWAEQSIAMGSVLKQMLVVVDRLIIKEREEAQKEARKIEMGWSSDSDDDDEEEGGGQQQQQQGGGKWGGGEGGEGGEGGDARYGPGPGCSVA